MSKAADISEPASELEHLIADLSRLGPQALRERYGNRDESRVDQGTLLARLPESS